MARFLSQIMTIGRGSIGGLTLTANQYHQLIMRARTSPVQPNTGPQTGVKSAFGFASQQWDGLPDIDRQYWNWYASTVVFTGPLGDYSISGRSLFMGTLSLVNYINTSGLHTIPVNTDPPTIAGRLALANVAAAAFPTAGETGIAVSFGLPEAFDYVVVGQHSIGFNPSRERFQGPWMTVTGKVVSDTGPVSGIMMWNGLVEDQVYFVRVRAILENTQARYSPDFIVRCVAVTNPILASGQGRSASPKKVKP